MKYTTRFLLSKKRKELAQNSWNETFVLTKNIRTINYFDIICDMNEVDNVFTRTNHF